MRTKLSYAVLVISMLGSLMANIGAIVLLIQNNIQRETSSQRASQERAQIKQQNRYISCVLTDIVTVQPQDRSPAIIDTCNDEAFTK